VHETRKETEEDESRSPQVEIEEIE